MISMSWKHTVYALAFALVILAVLMALPAKAQDIGGASQSGTLYLPQIAWHFPMWFDDAELTQAMARDGYDPDVASMHTVCYQDATSTPDDLRWSSCEQYYIKGIGPTEGTSHYIWWLRLNDGQVHSVEVGGTMVQSAGTDAPCYVEDDGEIACG